MRPESVAWERAAEVREAARGWWRVGAIDEATDQAIRQAFPDPCITPSAVWRVLAAAVLAAVILCTFGAFSIAIRPGTGALQVLLFLFAGACLIATDVLEASPRSARRGVAGATSLLGVAFFLVGLGLFVTETGKMRYDDAIDVLLIASVLAWGLGCWRWGSPLFAALSAISLFLFLGRLPLARALWVLAGAVLAGTAARRLDAVGWAPSHRRAAAVIVVAGLAGAYAALNVYSLDEHLLEQLRRFGPTAIAPPRGLFILAAVATAVVPPAILVWGARSRRTFVLDTGIVLLALSLVTLRHYVHPAPLWAILTLSGALLLVLALAVERALRRAPGGEIAGFTADPLFSDDRRQRALQIVPVVAAFTPAPSAPAEEKGFAGEGGRFGGGGTSEKF
jgi:hypothetical protein